MSQSRTRKPRQRDQQQTDYDFRYGETDLLEGSVSSTARTFLIIIITVLITLAVSGVILAFTMDWLPAPQEENIAPVVEDSPEPPMPMATVTMGPPTATYTFTPQPTFTPSITPTRGPCQITIQSGGSLIGAITNCGHRSMDVMDEVLALNDIANASQVRVGQTILIPWPTPTDNPNAIPTQAPAEGGASVDDLDSRVSADNTVLIVNEEIDAFAATPVPTLPAGIQWHTVSAGENLISVIVQYNADVKTLSELNREVDFARCDFGKTFGGPECIVQLSQGQLLRVPAPTPTPTFTPSPDPNATATPTPTATFNVPSVYSPTDREFFYKDQLVTLRWIPSATLLNGESYRVDIEDTTGDTQYVDFTTDIAYTIPPEWRGTEEQRHDYIWTVGIVNDEQPGEVRYQTEPRRFTWEGSDNQ